MDKSNGANQNHIDNEAKEALLNNNNAHTEENERDPELPKKKKKEKKRRKSTWSGLAKKFQMLWPYVWPDGKPALQVRVIISVIIIVATRGVNVLVPIFYKKIVDSLTPTITLSKNSTIPTISSLTAALLQHTTESPSPVLQSLSIQENKTGVTNPAGGPVGVEFCWEYILIFIVLKSLHGGSGYLSCLRSLLWIRVAQNTQKKMRLRLFAQLHSLSVRWHVSRKTGEVIRVMDRGVQSINLILSHVLFNIVPVIVDILIAIVFFVVMFDIWTGLIVLTTMVGYLVFTIAISEWRTKYRRKMNDSDNHRNATSVDSILNFETVKYYCAEDWEVNRYENSVDKHQHAEYYVNATANLLNMLQKTMMMLGLLGGSLVCAWYVYTGHADFTVGDYVLFATYVEQLYGPLNMFGAYYRVLQQAFVDMEQMFEMLEEEQDVRDQPHAGLLQVPKGEIRFEDVWFEYIEKKPILKGISFTVPPGETYALVGPSGGGKSTIIRLMFRFYDITKGCIKIDSTNIANVQMKSLRQHIGVVPQDTVLFNQDIRFNIRYGKADANDEEVVDAAKAADIHDKILDLYDGYESKVGERGLKLSGGEKQRVAIARTILKAPEIVLLDEATSALDTNTERNIQQSLRRLCENKTTVIVAHRLSTVTHANKILVIKDGIIVESGTDRELRRLGGHYAAMWQEQLQSGEIDTDLEQPEFTLEDNNYQDNQIDSEDGDGYQMIDETKPETTGSLMTSRPPSGIPIYSQVIKQSKNNPMSQSCDSCHSSRDSINVRNNVTEDISCDCKLDKEQMLLQNSSSDEEEIEIPVKRNIGGDSNSDVVNYCNENHISGNKCGSNPRLDNAEDIKSGNPRRMMYTRMVSVPATMPHSHSYSESGNDNTSMFEYTRQRSSTQGNTPQDDTDDNIDDRNNKPFIFNRQISCPAYKSREKEFRDKIEENEKDKQKERERVNTLREDEETFISMLADDMLSTVENVQEHDELIDPLCSSFNRARQSSITNEALVKDMPISKSAVMMNIVGESVV